MQQSNGCWGRRKIRARTTYSPYALLSLFMLVVFAYFQFLAIDNRNFLLLTFSSYIFLAVGAALLFHVAGKPQSRRRKIFVNIVTLIFIAVTLIAANSLATVPRGGIEHTYRVSPKSFSLAIQTIGEPGRYGGSNYPYETIYVADYPVGFVLASASYDFGVEITSEKPLDLSGTLYAAFIFTSAPGSFQETISRPIAFANRTSVWADLSTLDFWGWGSDYPDSHRVRVEGYRIELWVSLWVEGDDYGSQLNFTVQPYGEVRVHDYVVDSQLQNMAAILLCGAFAGILCYIPAKLVKPKIVRRFAPIVDHVNRFFAVQGTPKGFLKKCVKCSKEIPIASEECQYCGSKQPRYR